MLRTLLPLLACPNCRNPIEIAEEPQADAKAITTGSLACAGCDARFPIQEGIPRLMPKALPDAQIDEIEARDAQVAQYDANTFLNVFGRFEIPKTLASLHPQPSDRLLEAGCGTGRMTSLLAGHVKELVAVDFSFASLVFNKAKLVASGIKNVHLAQADICNLPFKGGIFDRALSCQVLEHVPSDDARRCAVASIDAMMKPGATVVISAYRHSALMGKKEGRHDGGIPFFRFTKPEFRDTLAAAFDVQMVTGSLIYLYLARCRSRPRK